MIYRTIAEFRAARQNWGRLGFVPTMGALHEGHLDLVRAAAKDCDHVAVSIFVNPTQFGKNEDFSRYPRTEEQDVALATAAGASAFFVPAVEEMYRGTGTEVRVPEVTELYEGAFRPGHFEGVATVVLKLFNIVQPNVAYFGQKDLQQCAVVRRMIRDLDVPVQLEIVPTTRAEDGLALSSRNQYLSKEERAVAPMIYSTLAAVKRRCLAGDDPESVLVEARSTLRESGFDVDYLDLVDPYAMRSSKDVTQPLSVVVAARLGKTRLIDNLSITDTK